MANLNPPALKIILLSGMFVAGCNSYCYNNGGNRDTSGLTGAEIGALIGGILIFLLLCGILFVVMKKCKQDQQNLRVVAPAPQPVPGAGRGHLDLHYNM